MSVQQSKATPLAAVVLIPTEPLVVRLVRVPRLVIFVCAAVVSVPAIFPLTVKPVKVPTDVILGCAAVVSVSAVADSDAGTVVSAIYLLRNSRRILRCRRSFFSNT